MRLEVRVRFVVEVAADAAAGLDPAGLYTQLGQIEFVDGAGDACAVVADADAVVEYATEAVTVLPDVTNPRED